MIAFVNTSLMVLCSPKDSEKAEAIAEYLASLLQSQSEYEVSGAYF